MRDGLALLAQWDGQRRKMFQQGGRELMMAFHVRLKNSDRKQHISMQQGFEPTDAAHQSAQQHEQMFLLQRMSAEDQDFLPGIMMQPGGIPCPA